MTLSDTALAELRVLPTSKDALRSTLGFQYLLTPEGYSPKTDKGRARGYSTAIMYLAPADLSGFNVCQFASAGCKSSCLNTAGHGGVGLDAAGLNPVQRARIARTRFFFLNRFLFNELLVREIQAWIARAALKGKVPCIRLNGTSDLPWQLLRLNDGRTVLETFPSVQFYDYTKHPGRAIRNASGQHPANYFLTFSRSETNSADCERVLAAGGNVVAVFKICGCKPKGQCTHELADGQFTYFGRPVVSADHDDLRFLDPRNVVLGLKAKGLARADTSGFVLSARAA